jgi:hypothetical protein
MLRNYHIASVSLSLSRTSVVRLDLLSGVLLNPDFAHRMLLRSSSSATAWRVRRDILRFGPGVFLHSFAPRSNTDTSWLPRKQLH